jgi:TrmH family RNA methyltransferase
MDWGAPITSKSNARVKALRSAFSGEARQPGELAGIEGIHLIEEAIKSRIRLETVFLREGNEGLLQREELRGLDAKSWVLLSPDVFSSAVPTESPQGIAATLHIPELIEPDEHKAVGRLILMLEDVQDPGNVGTLVRSAEAFGFDRVYLSAKSANPWGPKAMRASAGSIFRTPVAVVNVAQQAEHFKSLGARVVAAVASQEGSSVFINARMQAPCVLLVGNEGSGLSAQVLAVADERVRIPCLVESLNAAVAGSVMMYEALRQNLLSDIVKLDVPARVM